MIERFEDLIAWQKARLLTKRIYDATRDAKLSKDFGLAGQLQRAAVSVMSNIAEGYERGSAKEYHHFLVMAKASCAEVRSQLYVALDAGYIDQPSFDELTMLVIETGRVIGGLRASIARKLEKHGE